MISAFCFIILFGCGAALPASGAELQAVVSGKYAGPVEAYAVGNRYYLGARSAGSLYGAQVTWYPVAGRVVLSLRGGPVRFRIRSREVQIGGKTLRLSEPVLLRVSQAFIPVEFFLTREFSDLAGMDTQFDLRTRLLAVDRRTTVGPLRWFTYGEHTRVILGLHPGLGYTLTRHGRGGFEVVVPHGKIDWSETVAVEDGLVGTIQLRQEARLARMTVKLDREAASWRERELDRPRRLIVDVLRGGAGAPRSIEPSEPYGEEACPSPTARKCRPQGPLESGPPPRSVGTRPTEVSVSTLGGRAHGALPVTASMGASVRRRIVIDPGHGGKDGGALGGRGSREKDVNLLAAVELAELLREEGAFDVVLTRDDDRFIPLDERSRRANEARADLFISLHCNASTNRGESGFEVYFLSEQASDPESQRVADAENAVLAMEGRTAEGEAAIELLHAMARTEFINDAAELSGWIAQNLARRVDLPNRGVKQAAFYVLRGTNAPAVLAELGFISHSKDEAKLGSKKYRRKLVEGLYSGILDFSRRRRWNMGEAL